MGGTAMTSEQEVSVKEHFDMRIAGVDEKVADLRLDVKAVREENAEDHRANGARLSAIEQRLVAIEKALASVVTWRSLAFALTTAFAIIAAIR